MKYSQHMTILQRASGNLCLFMFAEVNTKFVLFKICSAWLQKFALIKIKCNVNKKHQFRYQSTWLRAWPERVYCLCRGYYGRHSMNCLRSFYACLLAELLYFASACVGGWLPHNCLLARWVTFKFWHRRLQ